MTTFPAPAGSRLTTALINHMYAISDATVTTVTAASLNNLSNSYTVAANDAAAGTCYRVTTWGNGTWGSTQQTLQLQMTFAGSGFGLCPTIGLTQFSASAAFRWSVIMFLQCQTTGVSGVWHGYMSGNASETAGNVLAGTGANGSIGFEGGPSTPVTQDTTVANAIVLQAAWGSTTGSPTITCRGTTFERLG